MHRCIIFENGRFHSEKCEMKWDIALYIYAHLKGRNVDKVEICVHEVYRLLENHERVINQVLSRKYGDSIELFNAIVHVLNKYCGHEWKLKFDASISEDEVQFNIMN